MIHARLREDGRLTDAAYRPSLYPDDVPLNAMPGGVGPWIYDAGRRVAVKALLTRKERLDQVPVSQRCIGALLLRLSSSWASATDEERREAQALLDDAGRGVLAAIRGT